MLYFQIIRQLLNQWECVVHCVISLFLNLAQISWSTIAKSYIICTIFLETATLYSFVSLSIMHNDVGSHKLDYTLSQSGHQNLYSKMLRKVMWPCKDFKPVTIFKFYVILIQTVTSITRKFNTITAWSWYKDYKINDKYDGSQLWPHGMRRLKYCANKRIKVYM